MNCPVCGKPVPQPATGRSRIYDSRACQQLAYRRRRSDQDWAARQADKLRLEQHAEATYKAKWIKWFRANGVTKDRAEILYMAMREDGMIPGPPR